LKRARAYFFSGTARDDDDDNALWSFTARSYRQT